MKQLLPIAVGAVLLVWTGYVHGLWTQRWQATPELEAAAARLGDVPMTVGDWKGQDVPLDAEEAALARVAAAWMRRYVHAGSGAEVTVLLMCGRPGPVSVHTPEWCYRGAGYEMANPAERFSVQWDGERGADFWTGRFKKPDLLRPSTLRIFWSWYAGGRWQAPDYPRLSFGRYPVLYKLYVLRHLSSPGEPVDTDPCVNLVRQLLPELEKTLPAARTAPQP